MFPLHLYAAGILLFIHHGYSQNQGDSCVMKHTNTLGFCAPAATCQTARRDYQTNHITPTFCNSSLLDPIVCCRNDSLNNSNEQTTRDNPRLSDKKCEEYSHQFDTVEYLPLLPDAEIKQISVRNCDYFNEELIVGRAPAFREEFPHMAAIGWVNFEGTYSFPCGGSVISTKFILTAARCTKHPRMKDPNPVIVRLGDQNLDPTKNDGASPIDFPIKNITKHPQYKTPSKQHDIALLELASDINFDANIRPACLWNRPDFPGHTKAVATGWGVVNPGPLSTSNELQKFLLTLLDNEYCNSLLQTMKSHLWRDELTDNQICAVQLRGEMDTPYQDPGSPLQVQSHDNCTLNVAGVMSFSGRRTQSGSPAVYTRVSSYLDWIESVVWPGES